ncbi:MAG: class I SAM-dependent methyltransferase [Trueperaceae bacterium]|nr:class I SAM-dependent methyltransferase [Trueperaceae bacterium]
MAGISRLDKSYPEKDGIILTLKERSRVPLAQSSNFLPLTAKLYEPLWRHRSLGILTRGSFSTQRELELMLEWLEAKANETILDAACSAGLYARTLANYEPTLNLTATDFSLPFLQQAKSYAEQKNVQLELIQADVRELPFEGDSFDAIVCGGSLNEFTDLPTTLAEFARVLKPGGRMWQMYLKEAEGWAGKSLQGLIKLSGIRFIDPKELEQLAQEANLTLQKAQHRGVVVMSLFKKARADHA